ncbi:MAG: YlxR family protein [Bacillota bacterium]|nr:YlxR family protein [Bacillota bacterium]HHU61866.1 YlxR family protein [Natronincola sp.]
MRKRHVPMRTCVGCRSSLPKKELIRVVRDPDGKVELDLTGKRSGRGVYVCPNEECLDTAVKEKQLERALATKISPQLLMELKRVLHEQDI